ncbi:MAG TPA: roadblock/LC7 domain-containing protein [Streptosporangiaceae bacterium]|jgi:predicted regulator of Ras-like GTPase activity (Roadblock/LC7/MglB family)
MEDRGTAGSGSDLGWLLDDLGDRVDHLRQAVILSRDGLTVASSKSLSREDAEHLSALAAGVQSLATGAGAHFGGGGVQQIIIELERAFLFVTAAGHGSCLAVLCSAQADPALIAYEMAMLVKRAGPHLAAHPRFPAVHIPAE